MTIQSSSVKKTIGCSPLIWSNLGVITQEQSKDTSLSFFYVEKWKAKVWALLKFYIQKSTVTTSQSLENWLMVGSQLKL